MSAKQKLLYGTELVQNVKAVQEGWTGDEKWDTPAGGAGRRGASKEKASLDKCLHNQGSVGTSSIWSLDRIFPHSSMKSGDWLPLGPAHKSPCPLVLATTVNCM